MDPLNFIYGNKPFGITTHQSDPHRPGYAEWLGHSLEKKLFVCHRLDRETTGAMIFAATAESAAQLTSAFTEKRVRKEYVFLTDRKPQEKTWTCAQPLENAKTGETQTALTHFECLHENNGIFTVRARPETGRTHQIRKHAALSHIPLLGDNKYGGTDYPAFFLHCERLDIPDLGLSHTAPAPLVFSQIFLLNKPLLVQWLTSIDRRQRLYGNTLNTLRWIHDEGTPLRLDLLGGKACAGWWRDTPPSEQELNSFKELMTLLQVKEWRLMHYSGQRQNDQEIASTLSASEWAGSENTLQLEFRNESGLSCGLFLDQRENRKWTYDHATNKNVLNLFAYTGAFSVAAACGGAKKVTTVDLSKNYIEWTKHNFALNALPIEHHAFHVMDASEYLKYARKKELTFDLIICDPPSFSRDKKGRIFRIEKDFPELLSAACSVLSPDGILLFSNNYEKWTASKWLSELRRALTGKNLEITEKLNFGWDFETSFERHMKAFLLQKK